ncbi:DNA topoisomerase IB [Limibacter armeniacum]|uniref:DNA topoisomerase IB n=1 Tax=Limibacter armeniacum TaxID=466084 RepID=UPI002FE4FD82
MKKLKHTDDDSLCYKRKKQGKGFTYLDEHGKKINDHDTIERIEALVIPPMWSEVWICRFSEGHIQATGRDEKGRKQYLYHEEWQRQQQQQKFDRMKPFGNALPDMRKRCLMDLEQKDWEKEKVLALMVLLLDETGIRIGNQQYAEQNNSYGLSTLRRKHLHLKGKELLFKFNGKSNQQQEVHIENHELIRYIKKSAELPGYELFRYQDDSDKWHTVNSEEVNEYIHQTIGEEFYCKDFRTWAASRTAIECYPDAVSLYKEAPKKKLPNILIRLVAEQIGNTESVCREYYVHPNILQLVAQEVFPKNTYKDSIKPFGHSAEEKLLLKII